MFLLPLAFSISCGTFSCRSWSGVLLGAWSEEFLQKMREKLIGCHCKVTCFQVGNDGVSWGSYRAMKSCLTRRRTLCFATDTEPMLNRSLLNWLIQRNSTEQTEHCFKRRGLDIATISDFRHDGEQINPTKRFSSVGHSSSDLHQTSSLQKGMGEELAQGWAPPVRLKDTVNRVVNGDDMWWHSMT